MKKISFIFVFLIAALFTQAANSGIARDTLPRAFPLGQYDGLPFETLKNDHEQQLLAVCKGDMEIAYYLWIHLLKHMETHATKTNFDLSGIKIWLYVFFNKDGSLDHISFYPKPTSRNFKNEDMSSFLTDFTRNYKLPLASDRHFQHYSIGNFPVMVEKIPTPSGNTGGTKSVKGRN